MVFVFGKTNPSYRKNNEIQKQLATQKLAIKLYPENSIHYTRHNLNISELEILRLSQKEPLSKNLHRLAKNKQLTHHSKLISLNLYLDTDNLLKDNGRVKATEHFLIILIK